MHVFFSRNFKYTENFSNSIMEKLTKIFLILIIYLHITPLLANEFKVDRQWTKLLHYSKSFLSYHEGMADSQNFYLAPDGKNNPQSELNYFIKVVKAELKNKNYNKICSFPARYYYLVNREIIPSVALDCPDFQQFEKDISLKEVSIEFSSYHLQSAASTFGHTFLRLQKDKKNRNELLDYVVNFAASSEEKLSIFKMFKGVMGGYRGVFGVSPYYIKVKEYNHYESRDIWSYTLDLNEKEKKLLIAHLWELGQTYFDYYYFDENCSWFTIAVIDAVTKGKDLTSELPWFITPSNTIKQLKKNNLIKATTYLPSIRHRFDKYFNDLTKSERHILKKIIITKNIDIIKDLDSIYQVKILDALLEFIDYKYPHSIITNNVSAFKWKQRTLAYRSLIKIRSKKYAYHLPEKDNLLKSRGARTVKVELTRDQTKAAMLNYSVALNFVDLTGYREGLPKSAMIKFSEIELSSNVKSGNTKINSYTLVDTTNIAPFEFEKYNYSYKFKVAFDRPYFLKSNDSKLKFHANASPGIGFYLSDNLLFSIFLENNISIGKKILGSDNILYSGPSALTIYNISKRITGMFTAECLAPVPHFKGVADLKYKLQLSAKYSTRNWNMKVAIEQFKKSKQIHTGFSFYY